MVSGLAPLAQPAFAGAWSQPPGHNQQISTVSREVSDFGEAWRTDTHTEFGFDDGWGLNLKVESETRIEDRVTTALGFRAGIQKSFAIGERASVSLQTAYLGGKSLDGLDCLGEGYEMRAAAGTSFALMGREGFVNVETAWKRRGDLCGRRVIEAAAGIEFAPGWQLIGKTWRETGTYAESTKAEASLLHDFGRFSVGLGWREEISGQFEEKGWLVSAWRSF